MIESEAMGEMQRKNSSLCERMAASEEMGEVQERKGAVCSGSNRGS